MENKTPNDKPRIELGTLRLFKHVQHGDITAEEAFDAWVLDYHGLVRIRVPRVLKADVLRDPLCAQAIGKILARIRDDDY